MSDILSDDEQIGAAVLEYYSSDTPEGREHKLHLSFDSLGERNQLKVIEYAADLLKSELYEESINEPVQK